MTWSYSLTDLSSSAKDQTRLMIGDTNPANPLLQDEEINYFLSRRPSPYGAAAEACRALATFYSGLATTQAGDTKIMYSDLSKAFALRAAGFENQAANSGSGLPYAGGISQSDKETQLEDPDRVSPQFALNDDDNYFPVAPASDNTPARGGA